MEADGIITQTIMEVTNMRRILIIALAVLLLTSLCGCSGSTDSPSKAPGDNGASENTAAQSNAGAEGPIADKKIDVAPGDEVLNVQGIRIVYTGLDEAGGPMGPLLMFDIENSTVDEITVQTEDVLINGSLENFPISTNVGPGQTKDAAQTIDHSLLEEADIDLSGIEKVSLRFVVFKTMTWEVIHKSDVTVIKASW